MVQYITKTPFWLRAIFPKGLLWSIPVEKDPTVYITFDDGPHPMATDFVLDQLAKYNAKATFFCIGKNVVLYPDPYKRTIAGGHAVANHTHNHKNGRKTSDSDYLANIAEATQHIHSNLFRPPYGMIKRSQARQIKQTYPDWKICMWSVLSADFDQSIKPERCLANVLNNIEPGSIILFHDSEKAWPRMSYALPLVLEHCKKMGWKMKAIPYNGQHY